MGRWLWLSSSLLVLGALSTIDPARAPDASSLGGTCESTRDCVEGTRCIHHRDGALDGQCSSACSATQACQSEFGQASLCLGADLCAPTCAQAADCPGGTRCNVYGWCERAASE